MRIIEKGILDLTPQERRQCKSLSLRAQGLMCEDFEDWRAYESKPNRARRKCRVIMIKYDNHDSLIAWALVMPRHRKGYDAYFYTRVTERNKGYGTILMERVRAIDPKPHVCPHDSRSGAFFKKHRELIRFDKYDARWLT